ncbi:hypothetical protein F4782DRAFT_28627 [Xylaria castorea]|nr:hypothetical protein F4782DRAFT_28627 [Xylaria castorea]
MFESIIPYLCINQPSLYAVCVYVCIGRYYEAMENAFFTLCFSFESFFFSGYGLLLLLFKTLTPSYLYIGFCHVCPLDVRTIYVYLRKL